MDRSTLKRMAETYVPQMQLKQADGFDPHPFCALYRLGLLGIVRRSREQKDVQIFWRPHDIDHEVTQLTLPAERFYLSHPALDDIIARSVKATGDGLLVGRS